MNYYNMQAIPQAQFRTGRGGPNLNLMSPQQRQAYQMRVQQQQWQQQQRQLGGASAISAMGPSAMRGGRQQQPYRR